MCLVLSIGTGADRVSLILEAIITQTILRADSQKRAHDGAAIAALSLGIIAVATLTLTEIVSGVVGVLAIVTALISRQHLRTNSRLQGARTSLLGLILGIIAVGLGLVPLLISVALHGISPYI